MRRFINILQDNNLNDNDFRTVQNAREDIVGELDAIIQYATHLRQTSSLSAQITIKSIIEEEQVHVGELMALLFKLDPGFKTRFDEGVKEFNDRLTINTRS